MASNRIDELLAEIERLRNALERIRDTPRRDGILTCQQVASRALAGGKEALTPREKSLGDPVYYRDVIGYLAWKHKGKCVYCGSTDTIQIDHVRPVSRGGSDDITNLVPACQSCNKAKGAQTAAEFGFPEMALLTCGAVMDGWRKRAEQEQIDTERIREALKAEGLR